MSNYVCDYTPTPFYSSELSEQANAFINKNRYDWDMFIIKVGLAYKERNQGKLDKAIASIAQKLSMEPNAQDLWEELWMWVCSTNIGNNEEL